MVILYKIKSKMRSWFASLQIKRYQIQTGCGTKINAPIHYNGPKNRVSIGDETVINSGAYSIPIGFNEKTTFWVLGNGQISIGKSCGITNTTICSMEKVTIGNHVLLGGGVKIYDTDFHSLNYEIRRDMVNDNDRKTKPVVIEDDVFIGAGTIVLKGTKIGARSVIGAGSVVCGTIPPDQVWGGNPARFIRNLVEK